MRVILGLVCIGAVATASAQFNPVSVYDFNGTLNPLFNPSGLAQALEARQGGSTNSASSITYSTETVGGVTKQVANFDVALQQFFRARHGMLPNGTGATPPAYVNKYTIVMDLRVTSAGWFSFFNTTSANANDGDYFIDPTNRFGISGQYSGAYDRNQWRRVAIAVDLGTTGSITGYMNGVQLNTVALNNSYEGRWAAYAANDPTNVRHIDLLADNSGEGGGGQISMAAFYDKVLTAQEVSALGAAGAPVPEPATMAALAIGAAAMIRRRRAPRK
jgi:hypothetical protein